MRYLSGNLKIKKKRVPATEIKEAIKKDFEKYVDDFSMRHVNTPVSLVTLLYI